MASLTKEQKKLVEDNHNLIYSFLRMRNLPVEEYYGVAALGICKASRTYNPEVANFSTYAYTHMAYEINKELKKLRLERTIPSDKLLYLQHEFTKDDGNTTTLEEYLPSGEDIERKVISNLEIECFRKSLKKDKYRKVLDLLMLGYKNKEIGAIINQTDSEASRIRCLLKDRYEIFSNKKKEKE